MTAANNTIQITAGRFRGVPVASNMDDKPKDRVFYVTTQKHPKFSYGDRVTLVRFESGTIIAKNEDGVTGALKEIEFSDIWMSN